MESSSDIMVISAHPDDAEFAAGGSIARWAEKKKRIVYIVCTRGEKGTSDRSMQPENLARIREREQRNAADILGVQTVVFLDYKDQELEDTPEFRKDIVRQIRIYRPRTIITSDPYRRYVWHRDHRIVGQVTLDAVYPYARDYLAYPDLIEAGIEPHKVREMLFWGADQVNHVVDITPEFELKISALMCHESQIKGGSTVDLAYRLRLQCRKLATGYPFDLGEGFHRVVIPD